MSSTEPVLRHASSNNKAYRPRPVPPSTEYLVPGKWIRRRVAKKIPAALTGCKDRMRTLPHINITQLEKHVSDSIEQPMVADKECAPGGTVYQKVADITKGGGARKCVFNYDDKYNFARIIPADSLIFDSHFESANLYSAFRVYPAEPYQIQPRERRQVYDLFMHNDISTTQHTQWFYFAVSNMRAGTEVNFFLRNYSKPDSMFNDGMRPLIYSVKGKKGWLRCGTEVCYFHSASSELDITQQQEQPTGKTAQTAASEKDSDSKKSTKKKAKTSDCDYTLSFTHVFEHSDDLVYFAFCHPYTYTDLQLYLKKLQEDPACNRYIRRSLLCSTLAGNRCDLLSITAPAKSLAQLKSRVAIIFTARVHPGETNASWIMQGILDFLTGNSLAARQLRTLYIFKIIPMLNPDGVINGNYRCSLSGQDLNRNWNDPQKDSHPTIYHAKKLIKKIKSNWLIGLVVDIHGHSRKHGIFTYGCLPDRKIMKPLMSLSALAREYINSDKVEIRTPTLSEQEQLLDTLSKIQYQRKPKSKDREVAETDSSASSFGDVDTVNLDGIYPTRLCSMRDVVAWRVKLLPRIIGATAPLFSLNNCSFRMQRAKATTMRMVVFTELGIDCCYTIEASLAGKGTLHFGVRDLMEIGSNVCKSLLAATPSMLPSTSPHYGVNPIATLFAPQVAAAPVNTDGEHLDSFLQQFNDEMASWKPLYKAENCVGSGVALLSEGGLQDMTQASADGDGLEEQVSHSDKVASGDGTVKEDKGSKDKGKKTSGKPSLKKKKSKKDSFDIAVYSTDNGAITVEQVSVKKDSSGAVELMMKAVKANKTMSSKGGGGGVVLLQSVDDIGGKGRDGSKTKRSPKRPKESKRDRSSIMEDILTGSVIGNKLTPQKPALVYSGGGVDDLLDSIDATTTKKAAKVASVEKGKRRLFPLDEIDGNPNSLLPIDPLNNQAAAKVSTGGGKFVLAGRLIGHNEKGFNEHENDNNIYPYRKVSPTKALSDLTDLRGHGDALDVLTDAGMTFQRPTGSGAGGMYVSGRAGNLSSNSTDLENPSKNAHMSVAGIYRQMNSSPIRIRPQGRQDDREVTVSGSMSARGNQVRHANLAPSFTIASAPAAQRQVGKRHSEPQLFASGQKVGR